MRIKFNPIDAANLTLGEGLAKIEEELGKAGLVPDEYFHLAYLVSPNAAFPDEFFVKTLTEYGGSEGIYLDIVDDTYCESSPFITGKTLDSSPTAFYKMSIASAVIKLLIEERKPFELDIPDFAE